MLQGSHIGRQPLSTVIKPQSTFPLPIERTATLDRTTEHSLNGRLARHTQETNARILCFARKEEENSRRAKRQTEKEGAQALSSQSKFKQDTPCPVFTLPTRRRKGGEQTEKTWICAAVDTVEVPGQHAYESSESERAPTTSPLPTPPLSAVYRTFLVGTAQSIEDSRPVGMVI
jgi:hypothetical protein